MNDLSKKINIFSEDFDYNEFQNSAIKELQSGKPLTGKEGVLTPLIKQLLEASLEAEMDTHLDNESSSNRRNGKLKKTVKTNQGNVEIETPRDRAGTFEPQIIKKRQTVLNESLDNKILSLYGIGMSYKDISAHLAEMYGLEVSSGKISQITDKIIPMLEEWRNRPLDSVYPVIYLDAIHFKVREDSVVKAKAIYTILGLNKYGVKEILGLYLSEAEGSKFWAQVLNNLRNRGLKDILIACIDGLTGFPEAISSMFPKAEIQKCVIHQIRNTFKYILSKDQKTFMSDLKLVYQATTKEEAETHLLQLDEKWGKKYPAALRSWQNNWENLSNYFKYPHELRRIIYTTNAVEGLHRQMRKYTKNKGAFTSENALLKLLYCACDKAEQKWTQPMHGWAMILSQLDIYFDDRLNL
tara:strand:- start:299 stop:1531 length:1233 start_codon:yes stop_codon:yes gene_type:complete